MEAWEKRLEKQDWLSKKERLFFIKFAEKCKNKGRSVGDRRIEKYRTDITIAHSMTGMGIFQMFKNLEKALGLIKNNKRYAFETKKDAMRTLGSMYNFKHNGEPSLKYSSKEFKDMVNLYRKPSEKRLPKEIITREEMRTMLKFADIQDRAIVSLLFDSGMRMGEFDQLQKSDISQIEEGLEVRVPPGKTGERRIIVVEATKYVNAWLDRHPIKQRDGPLWFSETKTALKGPGIAKRIRYLVQRMNKYREQEGLPLFKKPINPHNWRHSRASELGGQPGMTEAIMCKFFGWEIGSDMPRTYLHLTFDQVKKAVLRTHGKVKEEDKAIITEKTCRKCNAHNPVSLFYCGQCGSPLDSDEEITRIGKLEEELKRMKSTMHFLEEKIITKKALREALKRDINALKSD